MKITWYESSSTVKPLDIDYLSSPTTVYLHQNIKEVTDDEGNVSYEYEEAKLTVAEYAIYAASKNYENTIILMEAITDLYTLI